MGKARQAYVSVKFTRAKKNGSKSHSAAVMATYSGGFSFTEAATDEIDSISLELVDKGDRWIKRWMPKKGDKLEATIVTGDWGKAGEKKSLRCGKFCLDDIEISGPDLSCMINATSVPELSAIRSVKRTRTWKRANINSVIKKIAKRYHLKIKRKNEISSYYGHAIKDAAALDYSKRSKIRQDDQTDLDLITGLCQKADMGIKISNGAIILYNKNVHDEKRHSVSIHRRDMLDWSYNSSLAGTYTGVRFRYKTEKKTCTDVLGGGSRILVVGGSGAKMLEARTAACAELNKENERAETMRVTVPGDTDLRAGEVVKIEGLNRIGGRYFIDKATHEIDPDSGYTTSLELHKCGGRYRFGVRGANRASGASPNDSAGMPEPSGPTTPLDPNAPELLP